jgi:hypothetical protein
MLVESECAQPVCKGVLAGLRMVGKMSSCAVGVDNNLPASMHGPLWHGKTEQQNAAVAAAGEAQRIV